MGSDALHAEQAELRAQGSSRGRCGGLVVAGGQSRRMGTDKRRLMFDGQAWLERIASRVALVVDPVVLVLGAGEAAPSWSDKKWVVHDRVAGEGPLRGFEAGLMAMQGRCESVFVTSCDVPLIRPEVIARLISELSQDDDAAIVLDSGRAQPFCGVYRVSVLPTITRSLERGDRKLSRWLDSLRVRWIDSQSLRDLDPELDSLRDFDTPDEVERFGLRGDEPGPQDTRGS